MPELRTLPVSVTSIAKGDYVNTSTVEGNVLNVDRKQKFVYVTLDTLQSRGQKPLRLAIETSITVQRLVPTQAEKDAQMRDYRLQAIDRKEQGAAAALATAQAKFADTLAKGYQVSYSNLDDLLEAQANSEVWARVTHVARIQAERAVAFDPETGTWSLRDDAEVAVENDDRPALDRIAAYEYVKDLFRDQLLEYPRFTSRSTSQASNLIEDYQRQAQADFVSRHGYWF
jgi:hypothetical protein